MKLFSDIMTFLMSLSIMFLFLNHPMSMGVTLLLQTITIAMITGFMNVNFWYSYILFLIMIGGLLILFIYMTSIASNEMFNYNMKTMTMTSGVFMSLLLLFNLDHFFMNYSFNYENSTKTNLIFNLSKFFNYPSFYLILFIIIYLFITLVAVVKITKIEYGPLRQKF
uniref:NADH-ubiquinone oxidoreductase chain 6 n=1 Tax=Staphylinidae sp. BMNH 1274170 TaxID=1796551 RepID=A0A140EGL3_9COLE|nr:NADH dehydrogenase subunit 6 [Staphylinidae sp. BMNH 1274170]